jgi:hypothetical protein
MAERRMPEVVSKTTCLDGIRLEACRSRRIRIAMQQLFGEALANLRHLQRMCQSIVE